jgi:hypothetical protein
VGNPYPIQRSIHASNGKAAFFEMKCIPANATGQIKEALFATRQERAGGNFGRAGRRGGQNPRVFA